MTGGTKKDDSLGRYSFPLFVPATRPERFAKAAASGADTIIIDLEDAVGAADKEAARSGLSDGMVGLSGASVWIRINGVSTPWHKEDLEALNGLPIQGVMVPKAEGADMLSAIRATLPDHVALIALVETAAGIHNATEIAAHSDRMAFGSVDYALDMNCASTREAFLFARSALALAARVSGQFAPLDGVTTKTDDPDLVAADAEHALALGFGGKMLIHPRQLDPAKRAFAPSEADIIWARKIVDSTKDGTAIAVDGEMIDAPVLERARGILERQGVAS